MTYDVDLREADVTALDTATALTALGAATPGNFIVPATARRITEIIIATAEDWTADGEYGYSSAVHLKGAGIKTGGELSFPGPCGGIAGTATMSEGQRISRPQRYLVNIPVNPGGQFAADAFMLGEDMGSLRVALSIVYDGIPGRIVDMDYREGNLTAANTFVRLTDRNGATVNSLQAPLGHIGEVHLNGGFKPVAGPLAATMHAQLYGAALAAGGNYNFVGHGYCAQDDIGEAAGSGQSMHSESMRYITGSGFPVKINNAFDIQAEMVEDDVGTIFAIVGIGYY